MVITKEQLATLEERAIEGSQDNTERDELARGENSWRSRRSRRERIDWSWLIYNSGITYEEENFLEYCHDKRIRPATVLSLADTLAPHTEKVEIDARSEPCLHVYLHDPIFLGEMRELARRYNEYYALHRANEMMHEKPELKRFEYETAQTQFLLSDRGLARAIRAYERVEQELGEVGMFHDIEIGISYPVDCFTITAKTLLKKTQPLGSKNAETAEREYVYFPVELRVMGLRETILKRT